jgi:hypothetical protein
MPSRLSLHARLVHVLVHVAEINAPLLCGLPLTACVMGKGGRSEQLGS